jgi:ABC-type polysaccharide/polyol phosphate export permease
VGAMNAAYRSDRRKDSILLELWRFRGLLRSLVIRDLKVKYQRSLLGLVWTLLNPLLTVGILIAVFTYVIRIQITHYWAFLISGFFVWNFVQRSLYNATTILRDHGSLSRSVYYPPEILILSTSLSKLLEFFLEIVIVIALLAVFHFRAIPASLILFPLIVTIQLVMVVGLMFPLAAFAVLFYDVQHALPIVIMSLFYISPVFYPVEMIPDVAQPYYHLNPIVGVLRLFHVVLYEGNWPSMKLLLSVSAAALAICVVGHAIFRRYKEICVEIA